MAKIATLVALAAAMAAAAQAFPADVELRNNAWRGMVEPESGAEVPGAGAVTVTVRNADQFQRMLTNIEQINTVWQWPEGVGLSVHFGAEDDAAAQALIVAAQQAADAEAAAREAEQAAAEAAARAAAQAEAADAAERAQKAADEAEAAAKLAAQSLADAAANGGTVPDKAESTDKKAAGKKPGA